MKTDTNAPTRRPSEHAVAVPCKKLIDEELERRTELVRKRDNIGRGEAHETANKWLQSQIKTDLLAEVERGLYRIWYSRSKNSGNFQEVAIWFEGTLYNWPSTSFWLCGLIQEGLDDECQSIGTFFRSDGRAERDALEKEVEMFGTPACVNAGEPDYTDISEQDDAPFADVHR